MDAPITDAERWSDSSTDNRAFGLLSDPTRLDVLQALWEAHDPGEPTRMRFSELSDRIGADDPGRLNYHLNELATHFVRRTDDGYELRESGKRIVRVLIAGTAGDDPAIEPTAVDVECWYCGGQTEFAYRDGWRRLECTSCSARCVESFPPGVISKNEFPPSGLVDRTPAAINDADRIWAAHRRNAVMDEVCPECAGHMPVGSIQVCGDHRPDTDEHQYCVACGSYFRMLVSHVCEVCKYSWTMPTLFYPSRHPAVVAFYYEHGIEFDLARYEQRAHLLTYGEELLEDDPLRIRITIPLGDDELGLTFDESMDVIEVAR